MSFADGMSVVRQVWGWMPGLCLFQTTSLPLGLDQPFLFLRADKWKFDDASDNHTIAEKLFADLTKTGYLATVTGAAHYDFTDIPLLSPLTPQLGLSGEMDSHYVVEMMNTMTSAFFRQELQGTDEDLVEEAAAYPEMELAKK